MNKRLPKITVALLGAMLLAGCATKTQPQPPPPSKKEAPFDPKAATRQLMTKTRLNSLEATIYYEGTAEGKLTVDGARWAGTIRGSFLVIFNNDHFMAKGTRMLSRQPGTLVISPEGAYSSANAVEFIQSAETP